MKYTIILLALMTATVSLAQEKHSIVAISGYDRTVDTKLLNAEELDKLNAELSQESMYFSRAVSAAQKEWAKDDSKKGVRFPMLYKRAVRVMQSFTKREDGEARLQALTAPEDPKKTTKAKPKPKDDKAKKEAAEEGSKKALFADAIRLLTAQMGALSEGKVTGAAPPAAPVAKAAGKKAEKKGGVNPALENFKFTMTGTLYGEGEGIYYITADPGTLINGKAPLSLYLRDHAKKFGINDDWLEKKVSVSGVADLIDKPTQTQFDKISSIDSLVRL